MFKFEFDFDLFMTCVTILVCLVALAYILFDVNYFLRVIFTIGSSKLFQDRVKIFEPTTVYGLCFTSDVDIFFKHMNNARFVRELDFARFHFYERTGLYNIAISANAHLLQTAANIRYRRTIPIFTFYKIVTKLIAFEDKSFYLEHQFITLKDGFVRAIALSKQSGGGIDVSKVVKKLAGDSDWTPTPPPELDSWLKSMEISSARLKKTD